MSENWFIKTKSGQRGPFSTAQLQRYIDGGAIRPNAGIADEQGNWVAARTIPGLQFSPEALAASPPRKPPSKIGTRDAQSIASDAPATTNATPSPVEQTRPAAEDSPPPVADSVASTRETESDALLRDIAAREEALKVRTRELEQSVEALKQKETQSLAQAAEWDDERNGLNERVAKAELTVSELEQQLSERQNEVEEFELQIRQLAGELDQSQSARQSIQDQFDQLKETRENQQSEQLETIQKRSNELQAMQEQLDQRATQLAEQAEKVAQQESELATRFEKFETEQAEFQRTIADLDSRTQELDQRQRELDQRDQELKQNADQVAAAEAESQKLRERLNAAAEAENQSKSRIAELKQQIDALNEELEQSRSSRDSEASAAATIRDITSWDDVIQSERVRSAESTSEIRHASDGQDTSLAELESRQEALASREAELNRREAELNARTEDAEQPSEAKSTDQDEPRETFVQSDSNPDQETPVLEPVGSDTQHADGTSSAAEEKDFTAPLSWEEVFGDGRRSSDDGAILDEDHVDESDDAQQPAVAWGEETLPERPSDNADQDSFGSSPLKPNKMAQPVAVAMPTDVLPSEMSPEELAEWEKGPAESDQVSLDLASDRECRLAEFVERFGPCTDYFEDDDSEMKVDVAVHAPNGSRDFVTLVTCGMSDYPIPMPNGQRPVRAELMLYVAHPDETSIEVLRTAAKIPYQKKQGLGIGTIGSLDRLNRLMSGSIQKDAVYLLSKTESDSKPIQARDESGSSIQLFWLLTITDAERKLIESNGIHKFLSLLEKNGHSRYFDLNRDCYVKRRGWFRR